MWLMTPRGFFSAVQKPEDRPDMITVRARAKGDLESLCEIVDAKPFQEKFYTDYPWRIRIPAAEWAQACALMALEINYSNFKDEVGRKQGKKRASIYSSVWSTLLRLEPRTRGWRAVDFDYDDLNDDDLTPRRIFAPAGPESSLTADADTKRVEKGKRGRGRGRGRRS